MRKQNIVQTARQSASALIVGAMLATSSIAAAQENGNGDAAQGSEQNAEADAAAEEIAPLYGNINPFYGNISPFWGNISPFYGNISPFYGNITPFWGNISPFYGNISPFWGNINPFTESNNAAAPLWGNIQPFWEDAGKQWTSINDAWGNGARTTALARLAALNEDSKALWGAAITAETGQTFEEAFLNPLYAKYGIDPNNTASIAGIDAATRAQFFMDYYDGLMDFSGMDRVDHWMQTANWTPAVTQQQGSGEHTVIGILDGAVTGDIDLEDNIISATGFNHGVEGHGIGVASLIVAAHDGAGVMGIAPNAKVALHNPFDADNGAQWSDIRAGIQQLKLRNASVINASLGVPGTTLSSSWNDVFGHISVKPHNHDTLYVLAAGNDGVTQTQDVEWGNSLDTSFLVVGSVDPSGNISTFSNRPGDACLLSNGVCDGSGGMLKDRFLVAPGELLLVSDGQGGTVRRTGTSFAAPLVSGAVALLHDRWPWLASNPEASAHIILNSARDLGEEGVDSVYGHGLLDVTASQSPLDYNNLRFFEEQNGRYIEHSRAALQAAGVQSTWEADGVHFVLYEYVADTVRDFAVPLSTQLSGSMVTYYGSPQQYQNFLTQGLTDFVSGNGFTDVASFTTPDRGGWQMSVAAASPVAYLSDRSTNPVPHSAIRAMAPGDKIGFTAGHGYGAMALGSEAGFGLSSDYASDGGVNPLLGLASGGSFFAADMAVAKDTKVTFGFTSREESALDSLALRDVQQAALLGREDYTASAMNVRVTHKASKKVSLSVNYTNLREDNALLAVQAENNLLRDGSASETLTLSGTAELPGNITLSASATGGRSETVDNTQQLTTANGGVLTSAFALSATKKGVLGKNDRLRLSVSQPMHIERGELNFASVEVTDRTSGEFGRVDRQFDIGTSKRLVSGEMIYATPLSGTNGEFSFFGRATMGDETDDRTGVTAGARFQLKF